MMKNEYYLAHSNEQLFRVNKKENIALFNLIFIILIIFSICTFSIFSAKNEFYIKNITQANIPTNNLVKYFNNINYNEISSNQIYNINDNFTLLSDNFENILYKLKEAFNFNNDQITQLTLLVNNYKNINGSIFSAESFAIIDKNLNLIEIKIKIDDFRFLKIVKNENKLDSNSVNFEIKKIFNGNEIDSLQVTNGNSLLGNDESQVIDKILSKKEKIIEQSELKFQNEKFLLVKKTFKNKEEIRPVFSKFNLNKETFDNLISLSSKNLNVKSIKNAPNKEIEFQALFLKEIDSLSGSSQKNNQLIKIQYTKGENSNLTNLKKEMVYFSMNNKSYYLFKKNGKNCYFDLNGNSLHSKKMFSIPIDGKYRISSNFGMRFHPVLHYRRMHNGVDLAIRHGYPVKTAAGGVVEFAGRKGGYGNYLLINHGGGYKTGYGHLSRFEKNIRPGKLINKNQLVAYVGNTGTSSGPHLHYEIIKNNKFVDPLSNNPNLPEKLTKDETRIFKKIIENINIELEKQKRLESNKELIGENNSGNLINQV